MTVDHVVELNSADLQFRAVIAGGRRRGIRLERIFWEALASASQEEGRTVGDIVATEHKRLTTGENLTSALRVIGARWLRRRLIKFEDATINPNIFAIVQACPSPAFVLSDDKRIVHYNLAFLNFVQTSFLGVEQSELMKGLRLSLDTHLDTVLEQLNSEQTTTVSSGFVLGVIGRRVRGELKAVLSPTPDTTMVIAFIMRS